MSKQPNDERIAVFEMPTRGIVFTLNKDRSLDCMAGGNTTRLSAYLLAAGGAVEASDVIKTLPQFADLEVDSLIEQITVMLLCIA